MCWKARQPTFAIVSSEVRTTCYAAATYKLLVWVTGELLRLQSHSVMYLSVLTMAFNYEQSSKIDSWVISITLAVR